MLLSDIMAAKYFRVDCTVRRNHVYKGIWTPTIAEEDKDTFAVSMMKNGITVGHMPRELSPILFTYSVTCKICYSIKFLVHG